MFYSTEYQQCTEGPCDDNDAFRSFYHDGQRYVATEDCYDMGLPGMGRYGETFGLAGEPWIVPTDPLAVNTLLGAGDLNHLEEGLSTAVSPQPVSPNYSANGGSLALLRPSAYYDIPTPGSSLASPANSAGPVGYGDAAPKRRREVGSEASDQAAKKRRIHNASHQCPFCNKTFTRSGNTKDHMSRHEDRREHRCREPGCTSRFNTPGQLKSHLKHRHRYVAGCRPVAANFPLRGSFPAADAAVNAPHLGANWAESDWDRYRLMRNTA
ncbi:hypothetical protein EV122DRAFT_273799 [Schizophyllum commune]